MKTAVFCFVYFIICNLFDHVYAGGFVRAPSECPKTKYRSYSGSCNNLKHPEWGMANSTYGRMLPAKYGDGISTFSVAKSGKPLPNARAVSVTLFPEKPVTDKNYTLNAMQYGQIITHDMSMNFIEAAGECCTADGKNGNPKTWASNCYPIEVATDDPDYKGQVTCLFFYRTTTDIARRCSAGNAPAQQLSAVNHYLDLSNVYGNDEQLAHKLRVHKGGLLRADLVGQHEWPYHLINITELCLPVNFHGFCDDASDRRVNQNTELTVLQVLLFRNHNSLARGLAKINPSWDDERIYQEARKINAAIHQKVSYYEWLPTIIDATILLKNKIIYDTNGFVDDYDEKINPNVLNEHAQAAFRIFHSQIAGRLDLYGENRKSYQSLRLSDWYHKPAILYQEDNLDGLIRGLNTQMSMATDRYLDKEVSRHLFRNGTFGLDLKAMDIHRSRDHGLASYNDARDYCGLSRAGTFDDLAEIDKEDLDRIKSLYENVDDIDLHVGGSLEKHVPENLVGPTFLCILLRQFKITRAGDRFWFEHSGETGFTLPQLNEIRKRSISALLCGNGNNIKYMQKNGFLKISDDNPLVPCSSFVPLNLTLWKEDVG